VRVLVYQNPNAGHEPESATALITDLQRAGHDASWLNAKEHKLEPSIAGAYDLVIAAGGDGNVGRTARQMIGSLVPIGVLPLGTANNMASVLSSGRDNLVERIAGWRIRPFDEHWRFRKPCWARETKSSRRRCCNWRALRSSLPI